MKLKRKTDSCSFGHSVTHALYETIPSNDASNLLNKENISARIRDDDNNIPFELELKWDNKTFYKENSFFEFHYYCDYTISEKDSYPDIEELKEIVSNSHKEFAAYFNERRKEFTTLPVMEDISHEEIERTAQHLSAALFPLQGL